LLCLFRKAPLTGHGAWVISFRVDAPALGAGGELDELVIWKRKGGHE
jgi:hypothetical protein